MDETFWKATCMRISKTHCSQSSKETNLGIVHEMQKIFKKEN